MPIKKDNLNFLGFPRRERPKIPHFSFPPLSLYAIKSEPTTTSRRLTDRHEFWIGATTMTGRESSKSRQRVILYQPPRAHPLSSRRLAANLRIKSKERGRIVDLSNPGRRSGPIMHAVVMACQPCPLQRERGRSQANMQIFYRTAAASRPSPKIKKLWNIGAAARITVASQPDDGDRPNRPA